MHSIDLILTLSKGLIAAGGSSGLTTRILKDRGIRSTIAELNADYTRRSHSEGQSVVRGDATYPDVLAEAGIGCRHVDPQRFGIRGKPGGGPNAAR